MASGASDPSSEHREISADSGEGSLVARATMLKEQMQAERMMDIKARVAANAKKLQSHLDGIIQGTTIVDPPAPPANETCDIIPSSVETAPFLIEGYDSGITDEERGKKLAEAFLSSIKLPSIEKRA